MPPHLAWSCPCQEEDCLLAIRRGWFPSLKSQWKETSEFYLVRNKRQAGGAIISTSSQARFPRCRLDPTTNPIPVTTRVQDSGKLPVRRIPPFQGQFTRILFAYRRLGWVHSNQRERTAEDVRSKWMMTCRSLRLGKGATQSVKIRMVNI